MSARQNSKKQKPWMLKKDLENSKRRTSTKKLALDTILDLVNRKRERKI